MKINIPTKITILRILLAIALLVFWFVWAIGGEFCQWVSPFIPGTSISVVGLVSCCVFILASATDALDGYLARKWHQVTDLGKFLDPIADKMLVNSSLIFFAIPWGFMGGSLKVPTFCVIIMVLRDLVVDTMRFVAASKGIVVAANVFGKLKTIFQMIALPLVMLNGWPFSYFDGQWNPYWRIATIFVYIATFMSLLSGIIYVVQNRNVLKEDKNNG